MKPLDRFEKIGFTICVVMLLCFAFRGFADAPTIFGPSNTSKNIQPNLQLDNHLILKNPTAGTTFGVPFDLEGDAETPWTAKFPANEGTSGQVLSTNGANPAVLSWINSVTVPSGTGSVMFNTAGVLDQDNANFFWDNTNKRLGIDTATPQSSVEISGTTNGLVSGRSFALGVTPTVQAQADNAGLYGQFINAQFDDNGHTGVNHFGLGVRGVYDSSGILVENISTGNTSVGITVNQTKGEAMQITNADGNSFITRFTSQGSPNAVGLWITDASATTFQPLLFRNSAFFLGIKMPASGTSWDWTLPGDAGTTGGLMQTNGSGVSTWTTEISASNPERLHIGAGSATSAPTDLYVSGSAEFGSSVLFDSYIEVTSSLKVDDAGGSGGNVPHECNAVVGSAGTASVACAANEIATGGGVDCGSTALFLSKSVSTGGSPATGWTGSCTSLLNVVTNTTIVVHALCCAY